MISIYINCTDCGHCVDLHTSKADDPYELKEARKKEVYYFTKWINEYWWKRGDKFVVSPKMEYLEEYPE